VTGVQPTTSISQWVTVRDALLSAAVTGGIHCVTGEARVGSWGLDKRFTAAIRNLTGLIGGFGA